jgi:hypothetical protein
LLQTNLKVFYISNGVTLYDYFFQEFEFCFQWNFGVFGSWDCISFFLMAHQTLNKIMRLMLDNLKNKLDYPMCKISIKSTIQQILNIINDFVL